MLKQKIHLGCAGGGRDRHALRYPKQGSGVLVPVEKQPGLDECKLALMPSGRRGMVPRGTNLLKAAQELGVELESICGGRQTCMKCQVVVEQGQFPKHGILSDATHLTPLTAQEIEYGLGRRSDVRRLACAAELTGDVSVVLQHIGRVGSES